MVDERSRVSAEQSNVVFACWQQQRKTRADRERHLLLLCNINIYSDERSGNVLALGLRILLNIFQDLCEFEGIVLVVLGCN